MITDKAYSLYEVTLSCAGHGHYPTKYVVAYNVEDAIRFIKDSDKSHVDLYCVKCELKARVDILPKEYND